ncbi:MAG: tripartite tricarboxylate transporter substrate binding protein [Betaproteobacteria bacterium]|nr:tripartite tricarboxylate transporter substrate binding protein [Betaproteobacteria bacterium]
MKTKQVVLSLALALAAGAVAAQSYPTKPIRMVVGFQPGGGTDVTARMVAPKLSEVLGQPIIIENKPGAEARIATDYVAKSAPDGYTLLAGASGQMVFNPALYPNSGYDPLKAFVPITLFNYDPLVVAVHPSVPARSMKELVALAKAKPGELFHASSASAFYVATELFNSTAGVKIVNVRYKGAAPAVNAAVAGETSLIVLSIPPIMAQLKSGKLRPLGITGAKRSRFFPDIPTVAEAGYEFDGITWAGLFAPAGTPQPIVEKLYTALTAVLKSDEMQERAIRSGREPIEGQGMPPAEFEKFFRAELNKWTKAIKQFNIRAE